MKRTAMPYYDASFLKIHWNEKINCVQMEWKKFVHGEGFRSGLNKGLELVNSRKTAKWLADLKHLRVISVADQEWSKNDWFPRAISNGIRHMAIVLPDDLFAKLSVNSIMTNVEISELFVRYFNDVNDAEQWLAAINYE